MFHSLGSVFFCLFQFTPHSQHHGDEAGRTAQQEVAYALAVARQLLGSRGACRVHGGGFAGTVQAFVPNDMVDEFKSKIEAVLGEGMCHILSIRPVGGYRLV